MCARESPPSVWNMGKRAQLTAAPHRFSTGKRSAPVDFSVENFPEETAELFLAHTRWTQSSEFSSGVTRQPCGGSTTNSPGCAQVSRQLLHELSTGWCWLGVSRPARMSEPFGKTVSDEGLHGCNLRGRWRSVSVAEVAQRGEEFERMPPHDVAAEQCVLGGMLLSKDAISDVVEVIRPIDHYRPAHQLLHEAILDLYAR